MQDKSYRRIEVEWEDATAVPGWASIKDASEWANKATRIISVGIELINDESYLVLALSVAPDKVGELLKIPKGIVRKVRILK